MGIPFIRYLDVTKISLVPSEYINEYDKDSYIKQLDKEVQKILAEHPEYTVYLKFVISNLQRINDKNIDLNKYLGDLER